MLGFDAIGKWPIGTLLEDENAERGFPEVSGLVATQDTVAATSHNINLPSGIVAGNLLLVFFRFNDTGNVATMPGWTVMAHGLGGATGYFAAFYRFADGTEGATATVNSSLSVTIRANVYRVTNNARLVNPEFSAITAALVTNPDPPSLSPSWGSKKTLWIAVAFPLSQLLLAADPANYTFGLTTAISALRTAHRKNETATENPSAGFTAAAATDCSAWTVAVMPAQAPIPVRRRTRMFTRRF